VVEVPLRTPGGHAVEDYDRRYDAAVALEERRSPDDGFSQGRGNPTCCTLEGRTVLARS